MKSKSPILIFFVVFISMLIVYFVIGLIIFFSNPYKYLPQIQYISANEISTVEIQKMSNEMMSK